VTQAAVSHPATHLRSWVALGLIGALLSISSAVNAQSKQIATIAGKGIAGATFSSPTGVAVDPTGNLYVADVGACVVWKVSNGVTTVLAGTPGICIAGTGSGASQSLVYPVDVAACAGNVYFAMHGTDPVLSGGVSVLTGGGSLYQVDSSGIVTSLPMPSPPTTGSSPLFPVALTCDAAGDVFLSSYFYASGILYASVDEVPAGSSPHNIATVINTGYPGIALDANGGLFATSATASTGWLGAPSFNLPGGIAQMPIPGVTTGPTVTTNGVALDNPSRLAIDAAGNFYLTVSAAAGASNPAVSVFTVPPPPGGTPVPAAGNGTAGYSGDGGSAAMAQLDGAVGLTFDDCGSLYIADSVNQVVRKVFSPATASTTPCTSGSAGASGSATTTITLSASATQVTAPQTISFYANVSVVNCASCTGPLQGEVYFCSGATSAATSPGAIPCAGGTVLGTVALNGPGSTSATASLPNYSFTLPGTYSITAEYFDLAAQPVTSPALTVMDCATSCAAPNGSPIPISTVPVALTPGVLSTRFSAPGPVAVDTGGNTYLLNGSAGTVTLFDTRGGTSVIVSATTTTSGGTALGSMTNLGDLVIGADGNLYITDTGNNRVIQVTAPASSAPVVNVLVPAITPALGSPVGIFETAGFVYVTDSGPTGTTPRVVSFVPNGTNPNTLLSSATSGSLALGRLLGIAVNPSTLDVYVANAPAAGSTSGGNIVQVPSGLAPSVLATPGVTLQAPYGLAMDPAGGLYISDTGTHQIYRIDVAGNAIVVAGNGTATETGEGVSATTSGLANPSWLALDPSNSILISDGPSVRRVDVTSSLVDFSAVGQSQTVYLTSPVSALQGSVASEFASPLLSGPGSGDYAPAASSSCSPTSSSNISPNSSCTLVVTLKSASSTSQASVSVLSEIQTFLGPFNSSPTVALTQAINLDGSASVGTTALVVTGTASAGTVGVAYGPVLFQASGGRGTLTFTQVGTFPGVTLSTAGVLSGTPTQAGTFTLTVQATDARGDAGSLTVTVVVSANTSATATALASTPNPSVVGQAVTFTATVSSAGTHIPTGTVTFNDGGTTLASMPLTAGAASLSTSGLAAGTHLISAAYPGDANNTASVSPIISQVVLTATATSLTASSASIFAGQSIALAAAVLTSAGTPVGSGSVTFYDNGTPIGTSTVSASGVATLSTSALVVGTDTLTATYSGVAGSLAASTSAPVTVTDSAAPVVSISPASASVVEGQTQTFTATVTGTTNTAVTWSVATGGAGGTVSSTGVYTAPFVTGTDTLIATSVADLGVSATASVTVTAPVVLPPVSLSILETIHVADTPTPSDLFDPETIHVVDQVIVIALQSITVTPVNATIADGLSQTYEATGQFSDGSTQDLTSAVTWASSNTSAATMSGPVATGIGLGQSTISATLGSIMGSTELTVKPPYLGIRAKFAAIVRQPNGSYLVKVTVTNTGDITASRVTPLLAFLGTAAMTRSTPALAVAPGASATVSLVFPASAGPPGSRRLLTILGDATGTNPNGTPARLVLWAADQPALVLP